MCTLVDSAANGKGIGCIGHGHLEKWKTQVEHSEGFLAFFAHALPSWENKNHCIAE